MGVQELASAISSVMSKKTNDNNVTLAQISGNNAVVAGRSYAYTAAVDVPIDNGDWVYVSVAGNQAVVVGR